MTPEQFFVYSAVGKISGFFACSGSDSSKISRTPSTGVVALVQPTICAWFSGS